MNVRRTRLTTGLILLTYVSTHLINHALGLISLEMMEAGRIWFLALWRNPVGTSLLYASLLTHFSLALWSLYQRRHLRIPLWEALQLTLGLSIPPLLSLHFVGTRMAVFAKRLKQQDSKVLEATYDYFAPKFSFPPRIERDGIRNALELVSDRDREAKDEINVEQFVDERVTDELEREGFFKKLR